MGKGTVVVAGAIAQKPNGGGHAWVFLQYLLGFRALGWDVLFVDSLDPSHSLDDAGHKCPIESSRQARYLHDVLHRFKLDGAYCILNRQNGRTVGLERRILLNKVSDSDLFINFNGFIQDQEVLDRARCKAFLDLDPGFLQLWNHLGLADPFAGHDIYFTVGQNVGQTECLIPTCKIKWIATVPPVFLNDWPAVESFTHPFTSVCSWRGVFSPIRIPGKNLGLRAHEFRKFMTLPGKSRLPFELALDIHPSESRDLKALRDNGWHLVSPDVVAAGPEKYRDYIQRSRAEFSVAKNIYVETFSGWLSDRTACYLASGKPCVVQDTGLGNRIPTAKGLNTFSTLDEAAECVKRVWMEYREHCRAAREIAVDHHCSQKVLTKVLESAGVN